MWLRTKAAKYNKCCAWYRLHIKCLVNWAAQLDGSWTEMGFFIVSRGEHGYGTEQTYRGTNLEVLS